MDSLNKKNGEAFLFCLNYKTMHENNLRISASTNWKI